MQEATITAGLNEAPAQSKAEAFSEKMLNIINSAALALMTSIGHRTKLFDAMSKLPPSTSAQIASAADLHERYVREWLGAMVTGRIIEYNPVDATYTLPPEHAAFLTRAATPNNLAVTTQFVALLGEVENKIVECFHRGGGVPYEAYPRFHQLMAEESHQTVVTNLVDAILPLIPEGIVNLQQGIAVLDVGCGSGRALIRLAETFPRSRFTGFDFSAEGIGAARADAARQSLTNIQFEVKDVATLDEPARFDLITAFDAIHDQAHPARVLRGISDALRPGGTFLMQDIRGSSHVHRNLEQPIAPFLYTISCLHCMTVSLAGGGDGLGAMWGEEKALAMLGEAGFTCVDVRQLPHDFMNNFYIARKG